MRLENKTVLVTGGASGLGAAISRQCAVEGARVAVTDIDDAGAAGVREAIVTNGGNAESYHQDVTEEAEWSAIVARVASDFGGIDVLVNNAGIARIGTVEDVTLADWQRTMRVNLDSVFLGTRAAIRQMKHHGGGSIINMASIEGLIGEPLVAAYNAAKGGVRIFTKSAALHCAQSGYEIRVNSVHPGFVDTPMVREAAATLPDPEAFLAEITSRHPLGRLLEPIDIAHAVVYLASEESRNVTGSELVVDAGYTAR